MLFKARLRRAENCSLKMTSGMADDAVRIIKESVLYNLPAEFPKKHIAIIGDLALLPDNTTRPWQRAPLYSSASAGGALTAGRLIFETPDKESFIMIHFDGTREGNRCPIKKIHELADESLGVASGGKDATHREFFIQSLARDGNKVTGVGSAADIEVMFMKARKPLSLIKKKAGVNYEGDTSSVLYPNVELPRWKKLAQVDGPTKQKVFSGPGCPVQSVASLDLTNFKTKSAKRKNQIPKMARGTLPINWWERSSKFYAEIFSNFNVVGVIDLFGSANMAIACVDAEPPLPYLALLRNQDHVDAIANAIDRWIIREMGRAGPPPSKFYVAEVAEVVNRFYPDKAEEQEVSSDEGSGSGESL